MKLIFCKRCQDVVKGDLVARECKCGLSGIKYLDDLNAIYWGQAIPLGFDNNSLLVAIQNHPTKGLGVRFEAFVIPKTCETFKYEDS